MNKVDRTAGAKRRRANVAVISYLVGVASFVAFYSAFLAGANGYARDAWLWSLGGIVLAAAAVMLLWKAPARSRGRGD